MRIPRCAWAFLALAGFLVGACTSSVSQKGVQLPENSAEASSEVKAVPLEAQKASFDGQVLSVKYRAGDRELWSRGTFADAGQTDGEADITAGVHYGRFLILLREHADEPWAQLIRRIYEVDPLVCTTCGGEMRIVSVILEHRVITRILSHLARKGIEPGRGPPERLRSS